MNFGITPIVGGSQGEAGQTFQTGVEAFQAIEASIQGQLNARSYRQIIEKTKKEFVSTGLQSFERQLKIIQGQWVNQEFPHLKEKAKKLNGQTGGTLFLLMKQYGSFAYPVTKEQFLDSMTYLSVKATIQKIKSHFRLYTDDFIGEHIFEDLVSQLDRIRKYRRIYLSMNRYNPELEQLVRKCLEDLHQSIEKSNKSFDMMKSKSQKIQRRSTSSDLSLLAYTPQSDPWAGLKALRQLLFHLSTQDHQELYDYLLTQFYPQDFEYKVDRAHVEALLELIREHLAEMAVTSKEEKSFVKMLSDHIQQTSYKSLQTEQFLPRRDALKSAVDRGFEVLSSHKIFSERVYSLFEIKGISEDVIQRACYLNAPTYAFNSIIYLNCLYFFCNQKEINPSALNVWIENLNLLKEWMLYIKDEYLKGETLPDTPLSLKIQALMESNIKILQNFYQTCIQDTTILLERLNALQKPPLKVEQLFEAEVAYRTLRNNFSTMHRAAVESIDKNTKILRFGDSLINSTPEEIYSHWWRTQVVKMYGPLLLLPNVQEVFDRLFTFLWTPAAHFTEKERTKYQQFIQELETVALVEEKEIAPQPQPEEKQELKIQTEATEIKEIPSLSEEKPIQKKEKTRSEKSPESPQKAERSAKEKQSQLALEAIEKNTANEPLLAELQDLHAGNIRFRTLLSKLAKLGIVADRIKGDHFQMVDQETGEFVTTLVGKNNAKLGTTKNALKDVEDFVSKRAQKNKHKTSKVKATR